MSEPWLLGVYLSNTRGRSDHIAVFVSEDFDLQPATDRWEIIGKALFAIERAAARHEPGLPAANPRISRKGKGRTSGPGERTVRLTWI